MVQRALPITKDVLEEFSRAGGESKRMLERRKECLDRFASQGPDFGRYSRLHLDLGALSIKNPDFHGPFLPLDSTEPIGLAGYGAFARPLAEASKENERILNEWLLPRTPWDNVVLAGWRKGLYLEWRRGATPEKVPYICLGDPGGLVLEPIALNVRKGAEASLFMHWRGGGEPSFHASLLAGRVGEGASLKVFLLHEGREMRHFLSTNLDVGTDASVEFFSSWMDGKWTVGRFAGRLASPGASWKETHLSTLSGREHLDLDSQVAQSASHTRCDVRVKSAVSGAGRSIFTGNLLMEKEADNSEAYLSDHVLLLSSKARAESSPGLEIKALNVKAAHAASAGRIDENHVFYLQSRGLSPETARRLIVEGFLRSLLERSPMTLVPGVVNPLLESKVLI